MSDDPSRRALLRRGAAALAATATTTALAGCSSGDASTETNFDGPVVEVGPDGRNVFTPGTEEPLRVEAGTRVQFVWRSVNHNVVVRDQPDGANWQGVPDIHNAGHTHEHTFETPGEYHYVCEPHETLGMVGDLIVESTQ